MSEVLKAIKERRSVRVFGDGAVAAEELDAILEAASYAPSAMNAQACHVTALVGLPRISELNDALKLASALPGFDRYRDYVGQKSYSVNFFRAPLFLIVGVDKIRSFCPVEDGSMVMANILLAAHGLGLGAVWVNQLGAVGNEPTFRKVLTSFGFPPTHDIIGSAAVGRLGGPNPPAPPRMPGQSNIVTA
ncbi:MAG: nitroreductase family protein [Deltaproteobacteria bacterium]|jgi:nitroreductase|nr:nitroreductase family protein [Deltaproteobacteria bacterium]